MTRSPWKEKSRASELARNDRRCADNDPDLSLKSGAGDGRRRVYRGGIAKVVPDVPDPATAAANARCVHRISAVRDKAARACGSAFEKPDLPPDNPAR
jgi:hypothetical protein